MAVQLKRRLFHAIVGTVLALLFNAGILDYKYFALLLFGSVVLFSIYKYYKIPGLHQLMLALERKENFRKFPGIGVVYFLLGFTLVSWLFQKDMAVAAMMITAWGDSVSAVIGQYGKLKYINRKKTWEGIIAGSVAASIAAQFFYSLISVIIASTVAMLVEGLDLKIGNWKIDDNLTLPLISGIIMLLI